jgi:hypothetical protein
MRLAEAQERILRHEQFIATRVISRRDLINGDLNVIIPHNMDALVLQLNGMLLGETIFEETVEYPRDWWQAFKQRWFPRWLRARFPVLLIHRKFSNKVVYPKFRPAVSGPCVRISTSEYKDDGEVNASC